MFFEHIAKVTTVKGGEKVSVCTRAAYRAGFAKPSSRTTRFRVCPGDHVGQPSNQLVLAEDFHRIVAVSE
jgi:hypothetical protein